MNGILIIDKPKGPTSHDVVAEVKEILCAKKVGHLGTLDPAASGVLPLVINGATKFASGLCGTTKVYEFDMILGCATDTDDDQGMPVEERGVPEDHMVRFEAAKKMFIGEISQVPPVYSAVKIGGRRLYKSARKGAAVEAAPRRVMIDDLYLLSRGKDANGRICLRLRLRCRSGTYVRALCRDMGRAMGTAAHASNIRRLASGPYNIEDAIALEAFRALSPARRENRIKPLTIQTIS